MVDGLVTLVEATAYDPSVSNKLIRSEELDNAGWGKSGATITANATLAPDGTTTADTVVETGTHRGFGAEAIGVALAQNGHGHLYTLEIDEALHAEAVERTTGLPVSCLLMSSSGFTPPAPIDFAWFDSETNLRLPEFLAFRPFMHDRTVVGFHDTAPHHGYRPTLDSLGIALLDLPTPRGVTFGRVR